MIACNGYKQTLLCQNQYILIKKKTEKNKEKSH